MHLCVGATSRRVVEEAAKLQVHQIVASRRQVAPGGGYIGLDPTQLVALVRDLSGGVTKVIRDHGGPLQGGFNDDGTDALDIDVEAGFDGLHIDVSALSASVQLDRLRLLLNRYRPIVEHIEIGGEHDHHDWTNDLVEVAFDCDVTPAYVVMDTGAHIAHDQQVGSLRSTDELMDTQHLMETLGLKTKAHNADWLGDRLSRLRMVDAYNVAPEFGEVEVNAILSILDGDEARHQLRMAHASEAWKRWFDPGVGTKDARSRCALRYRLNRVKLWRDQNNYVREVIREAIQCG